MILMDAEEDGTTNFEIDYYRLISFWVDAHKNQKLALLGKTLPPKTKLGAFSLPKHSPA